MSQVLKAVSHMLIFAESAFQYLFFHAKVGFGRLASVALTGGVRL